ncbi:putative acetyltransferase [Neisseria meningitidis]|nr:putative acetyltransferase [Neisseria meningitidis]
MDHFSGLSAGCRIITGSDDFMGGGLTNPTSHLNILMLKNLVLELENMQF